MSRPWRVALHGLLEQHGSALTILELAVDRQPARLARFVAQVAATEVRAEPRSGPDRPGRAGYGAIAVAAEEIYSARWRRTSTCSPFPREVSLLLRGCARSIRFARIVLTARNAAAGDPAGVVDGVLRDLGTEVVSARVARA